MTWTKGPWNLIWWGNEQYPYPLSILADNDGAWIARDGTVSSEANAHLIAAAPDLAAFADDDQWSVVMGALAKWTENGGSDLVALGIIGQGLLILDEKRTTALSRARGEEQHDHRADQSGLDDGPFLPGRAPRKKPAPKSPQEMREIRAKAWATRRAALSARVPPRPGN